MKEIITSKQNSHIKLAKSLSQKKFRKEHNMALLEGHKIIEEALLAGATFELVFVDNEKEQEYEAQLKKLNCEVIFITSALIDYLSLTETAQGMLAIIKTDFVKQKALDSNFLVLDNLQDPGNLGAIIRTAAATGFSTIFMLNCVDRWNEKVIRSSMGNLFKVNLIETDATGLKEALEKMDSYQLLTASMEGETIFHLNHLPKEKVGIIIGNEGNGVSSEVRTLATKTISIPMKNNVESLNAAVSASILMYQFMK